MVCIFYLNYDFEQDKYILWLVQAYNIIIACYIENTFVLKVATISLKPQIFITEYLERKISHANHHAPNTIIPYALMYCANHTIVKL